MIAPWFRYAGLVSEVAILPGHGARVEAGPADRLPDLLRRDDLPLRGIPAADRGWALGRVPRGRRRRRWDGRRLPEAGTDPRSSLHGLGPPRHRQHQCQVPLRATV